MSYVELLKQEDLPEHVKEYVQILGEKSERLKTMVQDVFDSEPRKPKAAHRKPKPKSIFVGVPLVFLFTGGREILRELIWLYEDGVYMSMEELGYYSFHFTA